MHTVRLLFVNALLVRFAGSFVLNGCRRQSRTFARDPNTHLVDRILAEAASQSPSSASPEETKKRSNESTTKKKKKKYKEPSASNSLQVLRQEFEAQWRKAGVRLDKDTILIPNFALLYYWKRHDLKWAIQKRSGIELVAEDLQLEFPNAVVKVVPGQWRKAIRECEEVRQVVAKDPNLSEDWGPWTVEREKKNWKRWQHDTERNAIGYWTDAKVVEEMRDYLVFRRKTRGIPAVWMPQGVEMIKDGRVDLKAALKRCGGAQSDISQTMVPYHHWKYFERFRELVMELRDYLYEDEDNTWYLENNFLPPLNEIGMKNKKLHSLINLYGGRKFVAIRFGMRHTTTPVENMKKGSPAELLATATMGPFDLNFGVDMLNYIRNIYMQVDPWLPNGQTGIRMPSKQRVIRDGMKSLDAKIEDHGGYEAVARRLQLEYLDGSS